MSNPTDTRASLDACRHGILAGFCVNCSTEGVIAAQAEEIERLTQRVADLERALRDVKEWTDRCTTPGHPISAFCAKALGDK